jgi:hypothetical protein
MATAVVEHEKFAPTRYNPPKELSFEEWGQDVATAIAMEKALPWWLGDLLNLGENRWGEKYTQAVSITGIAPERLANYAYVAAQISFRNEKLSWTHHLVVAKLEPGEQKMWLDTAEANEWSSKELREAVKAHQAPTSSGDSDDEKPEVREKVPDGEFMNRPIQYRIDSTTDGLVVRGPEELLVALSNVVEG